MSRRLSLRGVSLDSVSDFTAADWVLMALAALDQSGKTPDQLASAYRFGKGDPDRVLDELDLIDEHGVSR